MAVPSSYPKSLSSRQGKIELVQRALQAAAATSSRSINYTPHDPIERWKPKHVDPVPSQSVVAADSEPQIGRDLARALQMNHPVAVAIGHKRSVGVIPENNFAIHLNPGNDLVVAAL